jgi:hypothetical protein
MRYRSFTTTPTSSTADINNKSQTQSKSKIHVELFTTAECSLCIPVKFILRKLQHRYDYQYDEIDISEPQHNKWFTKFQYDIPVVHINGNEVARHHLNEKQFINELMKYRSNEKEK